MNRKARKKRKMQLKRMGLEQFFPRWNEVITADMSCLPFKIAKHAKDGSVMAGKMRGYEFTRLLATKSTKSYS